MDAGLPRPEAFTLYVERLAEPYTGMPLLGVGGYTPHLPGLRIEVMYDGDTAAVAVPTPFDELRYHFSTQLPLEPATRVRVIARRGAEAVELFHDDLATIGVRPDAAPAAEIGVRGKLAGVARRAAGSVASGEILSPFRWKARAGRVAGLVLKLRQKARYKLLDRKFRPRDPHAAYAENSTPKPAELAAMAVAAKGMRFRPKFSVLMPVFNVDPEWFTKAVASVLAQAYDRWELCIADDASTDAALQRALRDLPRDPRIKLTLRPANGHICHATNAAADAATGDFVCLLDHDDALAPDALFAVAEFLQTQPDADLVYTDEDKIDAAGRRYDPQFKPDWAPELLLSYNYVNHFTVVRRSVFEAAGRFRPGYEGSQDHDLLLRVTERTDRVHHIPKILYHWRSLPTSTAAAAGVKQYVHAAGRRAVEDALERRKIAAGLSVPPFAMKHNLPVLQLDGANDGPAAAVIVHGDAAGAAVTLRAVKAGTKYRSGTNYLVLSPGHPADALNRLAAARSEEILIFLEAGLTPADPDWLSRLVAYLQLPGVGVVGGLIRDAAGAIESAGTLLGMHDGVGPGHAAVGTPAGALSYYFYAEVGRNVTAAGRGCLGVRRSVFDRAGGFDSHRFPATLFDVDFCARVRGMGLRCVHAGGVSFGRPGTAAERADDPVELLAFKAAYGRPADPFGNPNFSERDSFRPRPATPATGTGVMPAFVAAHNLNSPEGAPRYLSEIVLGLAGRGAIRPDVWSPLGGAGEAVYAAAGVPVTVTDKPWGRRFVDGRWSPREYEAATRHVRRRLRRAKPGVVIANTLLTFPVVEAAARAGVPVVWILHENYTEANLRHLFSPFARWRLEKAFALATRVVPASHDTAAVFARFDARKNFCVIHNGLDRRPFDDYIRRVHREAAVARIGGTPGKKRIIAVGTVCERKGQHTLVEAAAELAKTRDDFEVFLVGVRDAVPYAGYVRELVRRRGLEKIVKLVAETDDVFAYYRAADVFACTSHMETFSRAVLEAEAFGLPLVSTACGGISEQVYWGFNALRFEIGDVSQLAANLGRVVADDGLRGRMGIASRAAFENHLSESEMLDRYENVIRSAAGGGTAVEARPARRAA